MEYLLLNVLKPKHMKFFKLSLSAVLFSVLIISSNRSVAQTTNDSLSMGGSYANDLFYSLADGLVASEPRDNWDIAFYTPRFSAGIMINQGAGVALYTYPKGDTAAWATVDSVGLSTWPAMNNSPELWEDGAFNANQTGHPDYGWGIYNMVTHDLTGDSLYLLVLPDMSVKKLWIIKKFSSQNIYHFKYANLDGTDEHDVDFNVVPYESKRFAYYSIRNNQELDREPEANTWDLLFTKFIDLVPDNEGNMVPYLVTGATSNAETGANHFYPVADDFTEWASEAFSTAKNVVGANWKYFDMNTFSYQMVDSTCYFVHSHTDDVYKVTFLYWEGTATGNFALQKSIVSLSGIENATTQNEVLQVYPNPATSHVVVRMNDLEGDAQFSVFDFNGREVISRIMTSNELQSGANVELNLSTGMYFVKLTCNDTQVSQKLMVR